MGAKQATFIRADVYLVGKDETKGLPIVVGLVDRMHATRDLPEGAPEGAEGKPSERWTDHTIWTATKRAGHTEAATLEEFLEELIGIEFEPPGSGSGPSGEAPTPAS